MGNSRALRKGVLEVTRPSLARPQTQIADMFNKKSKKTPKPSQLFASFGIPTNIAVGPLGFRAEAHPQGDQTSYRKLQADWADSISTVDDNPTASRVVHTLDDKNDDPGIRPSDTFIPDVAADQAAESANEPAGGRS